MKPIEVVSARKECDVCGYIWRPVAGSLWITDCPACKGERIGYERRMGIHSDDCHIMTCSNGCQTLKMCTCGVEDLREEVDEEL